jgi:hypothetical protein
MVRGLKKKLLIGLLSAAVVGTSLAPNVPLVGSFAQEVKADVGDEVVAADGVYVEEAPATAVPDTYKWNVEDNVKVYKKDANDNYTKADTPTSATDTGVRIEETKLDAGATYNSGTPYYEKNGDNFIKVTVNDSTEFDDKRNSNDGLYTVVVVQDQVITTPATYKWSKEVTGKYVSSNEKDFTPAVFPASVPENADSKYPADENTKLYSKKTGASVATIKESENAKTKGYSVKENNSKVALEKNKDETVKVTVAADAGKVIKNVIAKIVDSNGNVKQSLTATAVDGEKDVYSLTVKATEDTINLIVDAETETLKITPTLDTSALSSKVGTASLTSSSAVEYGGKIELKVNLAEGRTSSDVNVTADAGTVSEPEADGLVLTYKIDTTNVTKDSIKITVEGQLDNDDLDTEAKKDGSQAKVTNTSAKNVAADANQVLEAAKAGQEGKNVKAELKITAGATTTDTTLGNNVASRLTLDTDLDLAGYITIDLYRIVVASGEAIPNTPVEAIEANKVTTLNSLLTVHYFLPSDAVGKKAYKVVRNHDGIGDITTTPNEDGEYIEVDGNKLTLHVKNLSDFAVLYSKTDATTPDTPDNPDTPNNQDNPGGTITPSSGTTATTSTTSAATSTTKAAKATTSTKKSSKTSSPKTADYAVNSLLALLTGAAGLFGITLINKKRKEDEE